MLRSFGTPLYMLAGLLLLILTGLALADEDEDSAKYPQTANAYDQALLRFNNNIKSYSSFDAFKTEVLNKVVSGTPGVCYELTGDLFNPMEVIKVTFDGLEGDGWQKTSGKGWRIERKDRKFTEYRVNLKAGLLSRIEGTKPRFFFGGTKRICEFQL